MNKHCQLFYKRLRILFPSIGFAEGKFLRDIKMQLRDFSIENPGSDYEDVVAFFGSPEEVFVNYIQNQGSEYVCSRLHTRRVIKWTIHIVTAILAIIFLVLFFYLRASYYSFRDIIPVINEMTIEEGEYIYEKN